MLKLPTYETGKPWTLRVVDKPIRYEGRECWGLCNTVRREIRVSKLAQKDGVAREVVLHELLHRYMPWMDEDAVEHMAHDIDAVLDAVEAAGIIEL